MLRNILSFLSTALVAFVIVFFMNVIRDKEPLKSHNVSSELPARYAQRGYKPYANAVDTNNQELRRIAANLVKGCMDAECKAARIYSFVQQKVDYLSDPAGFELIQKPQETLSIMGGDCEDLAILVSSLLWNVGVETQLVATKTHMFSQLCGVDRHRLMRVLEAEYPDAFSTADKRTYLPAGAVFSLSFNNRVRADYKVEFSASDIVSVYLLPEKSDYEKLIKNNDFRFYTSCTAEKSTGGSMLCSAESGNILAVKADKSATVSIKAFKSFKNDIYFMPDKSGTYCIPLDAAIRGGLVMPGYLGIDKSEERFVINIK